MPIDRARAVDPLVSRPRHGDRADPHPGLARPHPGAGCSLAGGGPGSRQFGDGRVRRPLPGSRARSRDDPHARRRIVRGQARQRHVGAGQCVRIFTGGVMPQGADTVVMQERAHEEGGRVAIAAGAVGTGRRQPPFRRRRRQAGTGRVPRGRSRASGGTRHDGFARHRRDHGVAQAPRRLLFHGRRIEVDRHGARPGRDLRQQPLHDLRHAEAPRLRPPRHGRRARRARIARARVHRRRGHGGRRHHLRRRVGGRGRLRARPPRRSWAKSCSGRSR